MTSGGVNVQALWRGVTGRCRAFQFRDENRGAITIQRAFRGLSGRRRAGLERDKYLFSKSQSQGLEFGRQMLLEHKLHATRLQSDVQLLTGEKIAAEEEVEAMMEEISEFEEAVAVLEREMHQLSKIETEAIGVLNEEARCGLLCPCGCAWSWEGGRPLLRHETNSTLTNKPTLAMKPPRGK